jgi:subtilisin family serine protease
MKKSLSIFLLLVILLSASLFSTTSAVPNEKTSVIVGFKELPDAALIHSLGGDITYKYSIIPAIACKLPVQAINALQKNPNIVYVEEDFEVTALEYGYPTQDWGITQIGAKTLHKQDTPVLGKDVVVGIIDTGVNKYHEDLNMKIGGGWDFVNNDNDPMDDNGHGTHCAGIVAAAINTYNGVPVAVVGVAPEATINAYKVLNSRGSGTISIIVAGINQAVIDGVDVISMSLGSTSYSQALYDACLNANSTGIVVVAASGNSGNTATGSTVNYPAKFESVIAVGATDVNDKLASFSSTGPEVDVVAPGVNVLSDYKDVSPNDGRNYDTYYMSGTSMACPHVAGTVALMLSVNRELTPSQIQTILQAKAKDLGGVGFDNYYGYGRIDAVAAVNQANLGPIVEPEKIVINVDSITMTVKTVSRNTYAITTVVIEDANGASVAGATVAGKWTIKGVAADTDTAITDASGKVVVQSNSVRNAPSGTTYTFTITNVVKTGCQFDASLGPITATITKP